MAQDGQRERDYAPQTRVFPSVVTIIFALNGARHRVPKIEARPEPRARGRADDIKSSAAAVHSARYNRTHFSVEFLDWVIDQCTRKRDITMRSIVARERARSAPTASLQKFTICENDDDIAVDLVSALVQGKRFVTSLPLAKDAKLAFATRQMRCDVSRAASQERLKNR